MNTIRNKSGLTAIINPKGAELVSLKDASGKEFIWEGHPDFWAKHSPVLFPIVGTLKDNSYHYNGTSYHLPRHGFARDMTFDVISQTENHVVFSLRSSVQTHRAYPFDFELQLIYTLTGNALEIRYRVCNNNDSEMPFSLGAHPAFALPGDFGDYTIEFEKAESLEFFLLENDLLSSKTGILALENRKLPLDHALFENDALVFKSIQSRWLTISGKQGKLATVQLGGFPNLGLWTKPGAPFLCIEPWFGYADTIDASGDILQKEGIRKLKAHSHFEAAFDIEIF